MGHLRIHPATYSLSISMWPWVSFWTPWNALLVSWFPILSAMALMLSFSATEKTLDPRSCSSLSTSSWNASSCVSLVSSCWIPGMSLRSSCCAPQPLSSWGPIIASCGWSLPTSKSTLPMGIPLSWSSSGAFKWLLLLTSSRDWLRMLTRRPVCVSRNCKVSNHLQIQCVIVLILPCLIFLSLITWIWHVIGNLISPQPMLNPWHQHCSYPARSLAAPGLFLGALGALLLLVAHISFGFHVHFGWSWKFGEFVKSKQMQLKPALTHPPHLLCPAPHSSPRTTQSSYL